MRMTCPLCNGAKKLDAHEVNGVEVSKDCYMCRKRGEVMGLKLSSARKRMPNAYPTLERDGFAETSLVDTPSQLMVVVLPDEKVGANVQKS